MTVSIRAQQARLTFYDTLLTFALLTRLSTAFPFCPVQDSSANVQLKSLADRAKLEKASPHTFSRGAGSLWKETLPNGLQAELLGHGRARDVTTPHYTRDAHDFNNLTAVMLGEDDLNSPYGSLCQSALIAFTPLR